MARPTTPTSGPATRSRTGRRSRLLARCRPTRSPTPPSGPARRSPRSTGSVALPRTSRRPTVDFTSFFTNRGVLVGAADAVEAAGSAFFGVNYEDATLAAATGWTDVPAGDPAAPPQQTTWSVPTSVFGCSVAAPPATCTNLNRTYNVYFYDSVIGGGAIYDHAIVSPVGKTGAAPSVDLAIGDFEAIRLTGANGLIGHAGRPDGRPLREAHLSYARREPVQALPDLADARHRALRHGCVQRLPAGGTGEDKLEKYIADNLPPWAAGDFAPLEAARHRRGHLRRAGPRPRARPTAWRSSTTSSGPSSPTPTWRWSAIRSPTRSQHQFLGLVSPTDADGDPNPCYDVEPEVRRRPVHRSRHGRARRRTRGLHPQRLPGCRREARHRALPDGRQPDDLRRLRPRLRAPVVRGQREQRPQQGAARREVTPRQRRRHIQLQRDRCDVSGCGRACAHRSATTNTDLTKACWAGGTIQIYINPARLRSTAQPTWPTYEEVRTAVRTAFANVTDPANPGKQVILKIMNKEELRNVDGSDSLHPSRSGDVVVVTRPPYQSDAGTAKPDDRAVALLRPARLPAEHGRPQEQHQHARRRSC